MPKRCAYRICKSDSRYPQSLEEGVVFFAFRKPKTQEERRRIWFKQCGRPHSQLNPLKINKNSFVCSKERHSRTSTCNHVWPTQPPLMIWAQPSFYIPLVCANVVANLCRILLAFPGVPLWGPVYGSSPRCASNILARFKQMEKRDFVLLAIG